MGVERIVAKRLGFALSLIAILAGTPVGPVRAAMFANPIVAARAGEGSADPSVVFDRGYYYYCRVVGAEIAVARARRLQDIGAAAAVTVFRPPSGTPYSRQVWAPELQRIRGRWMIYFAASDGRNANHRMYALQAIGDDPLGPYVLRGRVADRLDTWAIDGVAVEWRGKLYFVWSGWVGAEGDFPQVLFIAPMRDPWTISGPRQLLAAPDLAWERAGAPLLEGPEPMRHANRLLIVYSAGASWGDDYGLGVLTLVGADPLAAGAWIKAAVPVFTKSIAHGAFGVGHASFVRSPDAKEDWIVYHATTRAGAGWPGRSVRAQRFDWSAEGLPRIGVPVPAGCLIDEPSGTPALPSQRAPHAAQGQPACR